MSIFVCKEINSIKTATRNVGLTLSELKTKSEEFTKFLSDTIKQAILLKQQKNQEKSKSTQLQMLMKAGLPVPSYPTKYFDEDDLVGLIGEIISEEFLVRNGNGDRFYIKWKEMGTSKSRGLDIVLKNQRDLLIFECKNPHKSLGGKSSKYSETIARVLDKAFVQNSDFHTLQNIARLYVRYLKEQRFLSSDGSSTSVVDKKIDFLMECVNNNAIKTSATVTADQTFLKEIELSDIESKIHFDKFPTTNVDSAIIILIKQLQKKTQKMLNTYCKI